jgi:hypothetical protein
LENYLIHHAIAPFPAGKVAKHAVGNGGWVKTG